MFTISNFDQIYKMSTVEVEPGAAPESVLVTTDSCENFEQMSSSLEEIKNLNEISQYREESNLDTTNNENFEDTNNFIEGGSDEDDFMHNHEWSSKKKQVFVLSLAGKPIYSR